MEVALRLGKWRVQVDEETNSPNICGRYEIVMKDKVIAKQEFNGGYEGKKIKFSDNLMKEVVSLEEKINNEIKSMI